MVTHTSHYLVYNVSSTYLQLELDMAVRAFSLKQIHTYERNELQ